uniref:Urea-proton symporter DUR3 n=1 Tax=Tanacetum cinerariifolium TaxID=118510 RepID=A0A6L2NXD6_TANCI|nr:urea-proton symporter DUR3 [Tanacetum cinerariifolium]
MAYGGGVNGGSENLQSIQTTAHLVLLEISLYMALKILLRKDLLQGDEMDSPYAHLFMEAVLCAFRDPAHQRKPSTLMFTNDKLINKIDELNLKMETIIKAVPDAERIYLLEKGKMKKNETSEIV